MTHEHKIGVGITCTFLCLTGAVIGLKMRDQPSPQPASETVPQSATKAETAPEKKRKLLTPAELADKITPDDTNSKKGPTVSPGFMPPGSASSSAQTNAQKIESVDRDKKTPILLGAGMNSPQTKALTTESKTNDQTIESVRRENHPKGEISWPSTFPPLAKTTPTGTPPAESSFQKTAGTVSAIDNSSNSPIPNPEDYFTRATPVPMLPDMVAVPQSAMASVSPIPSSTTTAGPSLFTPLQSSSPPPPPPPPMQPSGSGAASPAFVSRPGESSSPPPAPKLDGPPRASAPVENRQGTPAWQPPLAEKTQDNKPAPPIPAVVSPAPSAPPAGTKSPAGSYFIQEPHSSTNAAGGSPQSGDKSTGKIPAPLPPPPPPSGTESGRDGPSGSGQPGSAAGTRPPVRPAPQVLVYDEIDYVCQPGDTFAKISARWYQTEAFAEALKRHNQHYARASEQMAKYGTITVGEKIVIPPADILEQRYGDALVKPTAPPASQMMPASYTPPPPPAGNALPSPRP